MGRSKFILGGLFILAAVVYLIFSSTQQSAEYFLTIDELKAKGNSVVDQNLRLSGAVIGDSIQYDPQTLTLTFDGHTCPATIPRSKRSADWPPC
jgi:cytochrome c-type biogenesis protein CcmE